MEGYSCQFLISAIITCLYLNSDEYIKKITLEKKSNIKKNISIHFMKYQFVKYYHETNFRPGFNPVNRIFFCVLAKFSVFRKFLQVFSVVFLSKISVKFFRNLPLLAAPKNLHRKFFCFAEKI